MMTIVVYSDNTSCVDGKFLNHKDTLSLLHQYGLPSDRPMRSSMTDNSADRVKKSGAQFILFPTTNRIGASVSAGLRSSDSIARRRMATKELHELICNEYRQIRASGLADMFARFQLARKYGYAHGYLRVVLKENGCLDSR